MRRKGFKHSKETKQKISLANLGKRRSKEVRIKMGLRQMGKKHPRWNGGKRIHQYGYIYIKAPENHPNKHHDGYILEHRLVMEKHLGRYLEQKERIHHINENVQDNRIENLILFPNVSAHLAFHRKYLGMKYRKEK